MGAGMPTFLSCRILPLLDIFYSPNSKTNKTNRIPPPRSGGTKRDRPHPPNGGDGFADRTGVQAIAANAHNSLPRFAQHHRFETVGVNHRSPRTVVTGLGYDL